MSLLYRLMLIVAATIALAGFVRAPAADPIRDALAQVAEALR